MGSDATARPSTKVDAGGELSRDAIREQLNRILAHTEFQATDKMRDFLRFVVEETLAGRKHRIKGYTVATRVFGRGDDFDPAQDPIVSIQAGRLRRALERYYLVAGGRDPIHIDVPKGRYVPRFTAQSVATNPDRDRRAAQDLGDLPAPVGPSIAVVPFDDLNPDPGYSFMAIGLTEDLVTEMTRFQDITVIACQRVPDASELPANPSDLGRTLGARFLLSGSVRRDPETVKVAVHLSDTFTGHQIWNESYSHPLEAGRLIATQEEIARSVVGAIGSEYGIIARRLSAESRKKPPEALDTYEAMLRYYTHQANPSPESGAACFEALQRAVDREPEYGPAWSALATLHCQMYTFDVPGFDNALDNALRYARRGVALEPGSQLGRLILAYASYLADDDVSFEAEIETALGLNPNSPYTVGTAGYFHVMRGDLDRGLPLLDRAIAANPCHPAWFHAGEFIEAMIRRDYEAALQVLETHRPYNSFWSPVAIAATLAKLDRVDEAAVHLDEIAKLKPDFPDRASDLLRRPLKIHTVANDLIDGLRRAGMRIESS